ncbi:aspartate/glutamate racemase family protein [Arthrobacter sp. GMC3]|uniref:aspartate/glutamate racemase family protein n=1 Tax=Arthrobacter sp. GMC3 TaxID=2058894 RepID=UPI000CE4FEF7|nr:aspartate/glutamate racemase family protein [Arthrobacter sp. GMC3]
MKKIGLLGGMSWESTALYYQLINERIKEELGGLHSARCVLASVDFAEIEHMQSAGDWDGAAKLLSAEAQLLEAAGAELLVLCTNTMHKVAETIEAAVGIEFLHLADVTAQAVINAGVDTVGLLGTRFTTEENFYIDRLKSRGLQVLIPSPEDRVIVNRVIYEELVVGVIRDESRREYQRIINDLQDKAAQGVILGCTEIELLIGAEDSALPVFSTTKLHAEAAVAAALA